MKMWTTFLEPLLGVPSRNQLAEDAEDVKPKSRVVKANLSVVGESNGSPGADYAGASKQSNGDENIPSEQAALCRTRSANGDTTVTENGFHVVDQTTRHGENLCNNPLQGRVQGSAPMADEVSGITVQNVSAERMPDTTSVAGRAEQCHNRTNREIVTGASGASRAGNFGNEALVETRATNENLPASEGGQTGRPILAANGGSTTEGNKGHRPSEGSASLNNLKVEREEGELSPNGDFEEDNFVAFEDAAVNVTPKGKDSSSSRQYQVRPGEVEASCGEVAGENEADADDEGEESAQRSTEVSGNASEAGEDVSGSESGDGEECSHEDNEEEEDDAGNDDQDAKAESEGEAEGEITSLPFSERILHTVKPLARHVPAALHDKEDKSSRIFYGNDSFYVLFRLHQVRPLMEYGHEKPEVTAVTIDPSFSAYLYGDFLSSVPDKIGAEGVFLGSNPFLLRSIPYCLDRRPRDSSLFPGFFPLRSFSATRSDKELKSVLLGFDRKMEPMDIVGKSKEDVSLPKCEFFVLMDDPLVFDW
ncbi:hypothetical protein B296_00042897 [Ensete ventricosum]|uniref:Uncharacterized protein n=1 Tax=Ensete ventricosum TaxID=4639 RepID=A0A426ZGP3_ENSVE|nr:hypothetical protein B296_00042897 [Ensete ventricosum]